MAIAQQGSDRSSTDHPSRAHLQIDAFLEAKLSAPPARPDWVPRDRLVRLLEQSTRGHPLTLVAAPAGYGKTTLATQWHGRAGGRRHVWVALDAADNDPVRLWTHIATALERAGCAFEGGAAHAVVSAADDIVTGLLPRIVVAMAQLRQPIVLVLDDYHLIRSTACAAQLNKLIDGLPPGVALVILTRTDPNLSLGRVRASGRLAEIRADRLAFDREEATDLLAHSGVSLSGEAMTKLMSRTEGWPAGLYLAALTLAGRDDPDAFVDEFSGSHRFIADYLTEEVLNRHPDASRDLLLSVSIFERFSASLCDHLLETTESSRLLHDLERSNLFVIPLDADRQWFRLHHLFGAVARFELEAADPGRVQVLHDRGAEWFAGHGFADEALQHAVAAGSLGRVTPLVQTNWVRYISAGREATLDGWLKALRVPELAHEPGALASAAWITAVRGDPASLAQLLDDLAALPDKGPLPDGTASVESTVALIRSITGYGGPAQMLDSARRAVALETDARSPWYGLAQFGLGHALYVAGDLDEARDHLLKAAYGDPSLALTRQFALEVLAMVTGEQGAVEQRRRFADEAMAIVVSESIERLPQASMAYTVLGESQAGDGDLAAAIVTLEDGLALRRRIPDLSPWPTIHHLLAMGRVCTTAGDLQRAHRLLDEAHELISAFGDGMESMRARLTSARAALRRQTHPDTALEPLTARELDVLRLLQGSRSLQDIAAELFVSRNTVKTHVQTIYRKLGASSRSEAVRVGRRQSLI